MRPDDLRAATHLSRLGVNPVTTARLAGYAEADGMTLRELVRYVLGDYDPAEHDFGTHSVRHDLFPKGTTGCP